MGFRLTTETVRHPIAGFGPAGTLMAYTHTVWVPLTTG